MKAEDVHIDLEEMEKWKKKNAEERLKFVKMVAKKRASLNSQKVLLSADMQNG